MKVKITKHHNHTRAILLDDLDETTYRRIQRVMAHAARGQAYDGAETRKVAATIDATITPENAGKVVIDTETEPAVAASPSPSSEFKYPLIDPKATKITESFAATIPTWDSETWKVGAVVNAPAGGKNNYYVVSHQFAGVFAGKLHPYWADLQVVPDGTPGAVDKPLPSHSEFILGLGSTKQQPGDLATYFRPGKGVEVIQVSATDGLWHYVSDNTIA